MKFTLTVLYKATKCKGVTNLEPMLPKAINGKPYHAELLGSYNAFDKTAIFKIDTEKRD